MYQSQSKALRSIPAPSTFSFFNLFDKSFVLLTQQLSYKYIYIIIYIYATDQNKSQYQAMKDTKDTRYNSANKCKLIDYFGGEKNYEK